jgi:hypothetical protein
VDDANARGSSEANADVELVADLERVGIAPAVSLEYDDIRRRQLREVRRDELHDARRAAV